MKKITLQFNYLENGKVKATAYEGTNKFYCMVVGVDVADCVFQVADKMRNFNSFVSPALERRAD